MHGAKMLLPKPSLLNSKAVMMQCFSKAMAAALEFEKIHEAFNRHPSKQQLFETWL
jgi:hypothetical protein